MNKKGFTLVELLGAMVILGIILALAAGVYTKVYDNQKEHTYQNKVSTIEVAAEKWAEETNLREPITITVKRLVAESFYQADKYNEDEELVEVLDPRDNSSMLCNTIDVTIEDGEVFALFTGEKDCDLKDKEEEKAKVKIAAYEYDTESKKVLKTLKNRDDLNTLLPWTRHAVLLVVEPTEEGYKDYTRVIYTNGAYSETKEVEKYNRISTKDIKKENIDPTKYANTYLVDTEVLLNTEYNIGIDLPKSSDNDKIYGIKSNDVVVRIDKEAPSISVNVAGNYTKESKKKVTIKGSDGAGSGLKAFYITTSPNGYDQGELMNDPSKPVIDNTLEIELGLGTYYVYAEDNVGNINDNNNGKGPEKIEIINIDDTNPSCVISVTGGRLGENGWYISDVELTFTTSTAGPTGYNYYFGTSNTPIYTGGIASGYVKEKENTTKKYTITSNGTQQYYGYIKTPLGVTAKCSTEGINGGKGLRIDKEPPTIRAYDDPKTLGDEDYAFTNNVIATYGVSGRKSLVCVPPNSLKTGVYTVTCTAISNNGLSASVSFQVMHSYLAITGSLATKEVTGTYTKTETCRINGNCKDLTPGDPGYEGWKCYDDRCKIRECEYKCTGSFVGEKTRRLPLSYPCEKGDKCPDGWSACRGDWRDYGGADETNHVCYAESHTDTYTVETTYCPTSLSLNGIKYENLTPTRIGNDCYYCPNGGTFEKSSKSCKY